MDEGVATTTSVVYKQNSTKDIDKISQKTSPHLSCSIAKILEP